MHYSLGNPNYPFSFESTKSQKLKEFYHSVRFFLDPRGCKSLRDTGLGPVVAPHVQKGKIKNAYKESAELSKAVAEVKKLCK